MQTRMVPSLTASGGLKHCEELKEEVKLQNFLFYNIYIGLDEPLRELVIEIRALLEY